MIMSEKIKVTQIKSGIGYSRKKRENLKGLGLKRMHQTVELPDSPEIRGMIKKVNHLVKFETV